MKRKTYSKLVAAILSFTLFLTCGYVGSANAQTGEDTTMAVTTDEYFAPTVTPDVHLNMSDVNNLGKDVSGNGNDFSIKGSLLSCDGVNGNAVAGFSEENSMYFNADEMTFADDYSVSVTFKANEYESSTAYADQMLVVKRDVPAGKRDFQIFIQNSDHTIVFILRDASDQWVWCNGPEVTVNEWHTAVATVEDNVMQLYFDGVLVACTVITGGRFAENDAPIGVGGDVNSIRYFNGAIDEVIISDEAAKYPAVHFAKDNNYEVKTLDFGQEIFTDRTGYTWGSETPEFFRGKKFNYSSITGGSYRVIKGGLIYALTPDETVSGSAPQEATLRNYGFMRIKGIDFQAFGSWNANKVNVYAKQVLPGEVYDIGKWAIIVADDLIIEKDMDNVGEVLYNGITLPKNWPPKNIDTTGTLPVPYLEEKPEVININTGRQLFVDDFLIESTTLEREWHKAEKYDGNPVMKPETAQELGRKRGNGTSFAPMAAPFSGGVWYDSTDGLFKMWYCAGWFDGTALAVSKDGINWERREYDVEPGTNLVLPLNSSNRDSAAVIMDPTADSSERFKMFLWSRPVGGEVYTSADGIHWGAPTSVASTGDRSTIFYNPFRNKWVYSIRSYWSGRARSYSECDDLIKGVNLENTVKWARADSLDIPDPTIKNTPVLYNLDAVAYESVMLGAFTIFLGPENDVCSEGGYPKITELHMGFSRDGFHWSRSEDRTAFIGATQQKESWERGYLHSNAAICMVNDDELWFYYTAFEGDESKAGTSYDSASNGMYCNASTGLATLRRDGFASMNTKSSGTLTTETVTFDGKYLFVNVNAKSIKAEILDENGKVIDGYSVNDCVAVKGDTTKAMIRFSKDLSALSGKNVKFRFYLENGEFYSFWVTDDATNGASNGYLAGGSVGQDGLLDTAESYPETIGLDGDVNGDKKVDTTDLASLKLFLAGISSVGSGADVNKDGTIDTSDLANLKLILTGY